MEVVVGAGIRTSEGEAREQSVINSEHKLCLMSTSPGKVMKTKQDDRLPTSAHIKFSCHGTSEQC